MGSITIAMIVVMLLSIMLVVVKGFASKSATKESIKEIIEDLTPNQMLAEYKSQLITLKMCALGGGLLTLMYAMQFFSGGELNPMTWVFGQWLSVGVGAVVVFAITATQYNLYQAVSGAKWAVFIIIGILVFVFISEIASTAERESELVKTRSSNSPAMQVALASINSNTTSLQGSTGFESLLANAQAKKAEHQSELKRCNRHASKGAKRVERCVAYETKKIASYQAKVDQYSQSSNQRQNTIAGATASLIDKVQVLQQDESQHASIIKFFKQFGITATSAMMFVAFILVNAFELGFHYSGSRVGQLKSALAQIGYDLQSNANDFEIQKSQMDLLKLRDARETKEEMERLKEEIRRLSGGGDNQSSPATAVKEENREIGSSPAIGFDTSRASGQKVKLTKKPLDNSGKIVGLVGASFQDETAKYVACRTCGKQTDKTVGANDFCSAECESKSTSPLSTSERQNELALGSKTNPDTSLKQDSETRQNKPKTSKSPDTSNNHEKQQDSTVSKQGSCASTEKDSKTSHDTSSKTGFSDTALLYPEWKEAVVLKQCSLTARGCRDWVKKELNAHTSKQVKNVTDKYASTIVDLLYIRGSKEGIISLNPKWKEGSRIQKYLLNTEYDEKFERARKEQGRN